MSYADIWQQSIPLPENLSDVLIYPDHEQLTDEEFRKFFENEGEEPPDREDEDEVQNRWQDLMDSLHDSFVPVMSWCWPVQCDVLEEHIQAILHLYAGPVCLIDMLDTLALGLTGGGMDLSWDLCKAYLLLGNFPPIELARRITDFGINHNDAEEKWVMQGCLHSLSAGRDQLVRQTLSLENQYGEMISKNIAKAPQGAPLPVLYDWLMENQHEHRAAEMEEILKVLGYREPVR